MSRAKLVMTFAFVLTLGAGVVVGLLGSRLPESRGDRSSSWFARELDLTAKQNDQMRAIWSDFREKSNIGDRRRDLDEQRTQKVLALLSDEQKAQYEKIIEDHKKQMQELGRERDALYKQAVEQTKAMLTPEQASKWEAIQQKRGQGGPGGPGGPKGEGHDGRDGHDGHDFHRGPGTGPATRPSR